MLEEIKEASDKQDKIVADFEGWRPLSKIAYDYFYSHSLKWSASCCKWGDVIAENDTMIRQEVIFGCRTDGVYNKANNHWDGVCSLVVLGEIDIPKRGYNIPQRLDSVSFSVKDMKRRVNVK